MPYNDPSRAAVLITPPGILEQSEFLEDLAFHAPEFYPRAARILTDLSLLHDLQREEFEHSKFMDKARLKAEQDDANREFDIEFKLTKRGQNLAFGSILSVRILAGLAMYHGDGLVSGIFAVFGGGSLASMVYSFISGRRVSTPAPAPDQL